MYYIGWQGVAAFVIAFATGVGVVGGWPNKYQWLIIISGAAVAFVKGVDAYLRNGSGQ